MWVAGAVAPAVPGEQFRHQGDQPLADRRLRAVLEEAPHDGGRDERLRDSRGSPSRSRLPHRGVREIAAVVVATQKVRDNPIHPQVGEQTHEPDNGTWWVELFQ